MNIKKQSVNSGPHEMINSSLITKNTLLIINHIVSFADIEAEGY